MSQFCMGCMEQFDDGLDVCPHCGFVRGTKDGNAIHMEPGEVLHERYIIGRAIGWGGFGVTYIGWDAVLEHKVAVKEYMPSEFSTRSIGSKAVTVFGGKKAEQFESGKQKFHEEAKKLARFNTDDGIVRVYDSFEENGTAYIVMELLEGETLESRLKREKKIPYDKAIEMILPVAEALKAVHADGVIHRDIAPDNIFLTTDGKVKLIDFGAARFATTSHSRSLSVLIKPGYSPEEQYRSRGDQGAYTDIYALGAVLYHMITGAVPPDALERRAYFENKKKDILTPISKYTKDVPESRQNAILNAMNVRIEDRTQTAADLIRELTTDEPVKRRSGKIKPTDFFSWPLWAKIALPLAAAVILTVSVLFGMGVIGFRNHITKEITVPEGMSRVPSVVNTEIDEAGQRLSDAVLLYAIAGKTYSHDVPAERILSQSLEGGAVVQQNSVVELVISGGQEKVLVPDLIGIYQDDAVSQLTEAGFLCEIREAFSDVIGAGAVLEQDPAPDTEYARGETVVLTVSKGMDPEKQTDAGEATVPDFTGKTYAQAMQLAQENGLLIAAKTKEYSTKYEKDIIMSQNIAAGEKRMRGETVELTVSLGVRTLKMPDLQYKEESDAVSVLESSGITAEISYTESDTVRAGLVMTQDPPAGENVSSGMTVKLVVSKGAAAFEMPDVTGKTEEEAVSLLRGRGLSAETAYEHSSSSAGVVLRQSIAAGTEVSAGDTVTLTVSTGEELVAVPDVTGQSESSASSQLRSSGFTVGASNQVYSDTVPKGQVISQAPAAGTQRKKGDQVLLTVSRGAEQIQIPDVAGKSRSVAENTLSERGFAVSVSEEYSDSVVSGAVIRQTPSAGRSAARGTTVSLVVSKGKKVTERTVTSAAVNFKQNGDLTYFIGESLNPDLTEVTLTFSDGKTETPKTGISYAPWSFDTPGDTEVGVYYKGERVTSFTVHVREPSISISASKEYFVQGDEIDFLVQGSVISNSEGLGSASYYNLIGYPRHVLVEYESGGNASVTYTSSNPDVLRVDTDAEKIYTGHSGRATITATLTEGGRTYSASVEIQVKRLIDAMIPTVTDAWNDSTDWEGRSDCSELSVTTVFPNERTVKYYGCTVDYRGAMMPEAVILESGFQQEIYRSATDFGLRAFKKSDDDSTVWFELKLETEMDVEPSPFTNTIRVRLIFSGNEHGEYECTLTRPSVTYGNSTDSDTCYLADYEIHA